MTKPIRSEFYTQQILKYFQGKPDGRYKPFDVRMDLDISPTSWRWFSTRHLYPKGSEVRSKLAELGVSIETVMCPVKTVENHLARAPFPTSTFVVTRAALDGR